MGEEEAVQHRAIAVTGIGLLLALAATMGPLPQAAGDPGASLAVRLPDAVRTLVVVLLALSVLLLLAVQRPRPRTEHEPQSPMEPRRRPSWLAAVVALLPLLVLLAIVWYLLWHPWAEEGHPIEAAFTAIAGLLDLLASARKPPTSVPFFDATIAGLLLLFALAVFALMVLVVLAERLERWWAGRGIPGAARSPADPVGRLDDPRAESDPRLGVILAYGRFEHAAATARAARVPWQTPAEFMRVVVGRLPVPEAAVRRLTGLFEVARFSDRPVDPVARDAACDSLDEITAALDEASPPAPMERGRGD
jgi:hypothetical protein